MEAEDLRDIMESSTTITQETHGRPESHVITEHIYIHIYIHTHPGRSTVSRIDRIG